MADLLQFDIPSGARIADAVRTVEDMVPRARPLVFDAIASNVRGSRTFRVCTYTGSWSIGATKTVTFKNQTSTPNTVSAINIYSGVGAGDGFIARDGTAWYLVGVNLTLQAGYLSTGEQVLGQDAGIIKWYGVTTCTAT